LKRKQEEKTCKKAERKSASLAKGKEVLLAVNHRMTYWLPNISPLSQQLVLQKHLVVVPVK